VKAVIQAGERGTRLMPIGAKPVLEGAKPVLELLVKWLRRNAIEERHMTTGYLGHLIRSFCGDGRQWGLHDLAHRLLAKNVPAPVHKHQGLWLDLGRGEDFHKAQDIRRQEHAPSLMVVGA
jgi:hypothetical protein